MQNFLYKKDMILETKDGQSLLVTDVDDGEKYPLSVVHLCGERRGKTNRYSKSAIRRVQGTKQENPELLI